MRCGKGNVRIIPFLSVLTFLLLCFLCYVPGASNLQPTRDDGSWFFLNPEDLRAGKYHTTHEELFGKYVAGYNYYVIKGIDIVQSYAPDGRGYFTGITARPPESPIGYRLRLFGKPLLDPPRTTSYCSGATYAAFIEAMNMIFPGGAEKITSERLEAMRLQEPDGSRREDRVKFWGYWNADGFGNHFALVQYSGMGKVVSPKQARPGDFMNISWESGYGHSVIFLGWTRDKKGTMGIVYWSSQMDTNGLGDVVLSSVKRIKGLKVVRLTKPERIFTFNVKQSVKSSVPADTIF